MYYWKCIGRQKRKIVGSRTMHLKGSFELQASSTYIWKANLKAGDQEAPLRVRSIMKDLDKDVNVGSVAAKVKLDEGHLYAQSGRFASR